MSGHIFHPGHAELHGITVVVETYGSRTYVGRYDSEGADGVHLFDVGIHEAGSEGISKEDYIRKSARFGVRSQVRQLVVPADQVARISRLGEVASF
jgi:hypothetical protein